MISRRELLQNSAMGAFSIAGGTLTQPFRPSRSPGETITLAVMGVNGRGSDLAKEFVKFPNVEIAVICEVDDRVVSKGLAAVASKQTRIPKVEKDIRKVLEMKDVDALVVAAPDHWHAPAAIMGLAAGKHVYSEKPACHNPYEGELLVAAAQKHNRQILQIGTQRRSLPPVQQAIAKLRDGIIGKPLFARGWYNNTRPNIGHASKGPVPVGLDYALWEGPAPELGYQANYVHYTWHWFWHWGTGELGNNGIHSLDVCRWGLGVDYPTRVTAGGGKYRYDDDQETPDSLVTTYHFGDKAITWEGRSWSPRGFEGSTFGIAFYGEGGSMVIDGGNYSIYDIKDKLISTTKGPLHETEHLQNFLDGIRNGAKPNAPAVEAVKSTYLCHLGNIAYRTGRTIDCDPRTGRILHDKEAIALCRRSYRPGWEPKV